jgi:cell division protein ZapA
MTDSNTISVHIFDKEYQVSCLPEEVEELKASSQLLDERMREIRETGKVVGLDRIAVIAALNIAHMFLGLKSDHSNVVTDTNGILSELTERVGKVLAQQKQTNT